MPTKIGRAVVVKNPARKGGWIVQCWDTQGKQMFDKDFHSDNFVVATKMAEYLQAEDQE